jgi:hypothetical protein
MEKNNDKGSPVGKRNHKYGESLEELKRIT